MRGFGNKPDGSADERNVGQLRRCHRLSWRAIRRACIRAGVDGARRMPPPHRGETQ
jgi:hypothetical protein